MKDYKNSTEPVKSKLNSYHQGSSKVFDYTGKNVLDIGCGAGAFMKYLTEQGKCKSTMGIDPNPHNIEICLKEGLQCESGCFPQDLNDKISEYPADIITSFEVIEHLYTCMDFFASANDLLKKTNGTFIVSTPNAFHILRMFDFVFKQKLRDPLTDPTRSADPQHIRLYSYNALKRGLKDSGFNEIRGYGVFKTKNKVFVLKNPFLIKYFANYLLFTAR